MLTPSMDRAALVESAVDRIITEINVNGHVMLTTPELAVVGDDLGGLDDESFKRVIVGVRDGIANKKRTLRAMRKILKGLMAARRFRQMQPAGSA